MIKKSFGYIRVSGKGQVEGDGLIRQEKAVLDYAEEHEIKVEKIFREEGVSGTLENRPALAEMMISLENNGHGINTVIIERVDRLARDLMVQEAIINDFKKSGFNIISVFEGDDLLKDDPTRKLVRQVLGAISEYDKTMIVLKLRAARERKRVKEGKCEGRKGYVEVAPEIIKEIKRLRRNRKGMKKRTYIDAAEELNGQGLKTRTGRTFTGQIVQNILQAEKR